MQDTGVPHARGGSARSSQASGSNTSEVLIELMQAISDPGAIHPALAAAVREQAFAVHEFGRLRLRGTAFDGRLFAIEGGTTPELWASLP